MSVDELTSAIIAWTAERLPETPARFAAPAEAGGDGVTIHALRLRSNAELRNSQARRDPIVDLLEASFLVSFRFADPLAAMKAAADFHFAALEGAPFVVDGEADPLALARDLGLPPALGLVIVGRVVRQRAVQPIPLVREHRLNLRDRAALEDGGQNA